MGELLKRPGIGGGRIATSGAAALVCACALLASIAAAAQAAGSVAPPAGATRKLDLAVGRYVADTSAEILKSGTKLSPRDKRTLQMAKLLQSPPVSAVSTALAEKHRLTAPQLATLQRAARLVRRDPTIKLLAKQGRGLKSHPSELRTAAKEIAGSLAAREEIPGLAASGLGAILPDPSLTTAYASRVARWLRRPAGLEALRRLPPALLANLVQNAGAGRPSAGAAVARPLTRGGRGAVAATASVSQAGQPCHLQLNPFSGDPVSAGTVAATHLTIGLAEDQLVDEPIDEARKELVFGGVAWLAEHGEVGPARILAGGWLVYKVFSTLDTIASVRTNYSTYAATMCPYRIELSPESAQAASNTWVTYTATSLDANDNALGPAPVVLNVAAGECRGMRCRAATPGPHTVTASNPHTGQTVTSELDVLGEKRRLDIGPSRQTTSEVPVRFQAHLIEEGGGQTYDRGDVTASTTFNIQPQPVDTCVLSTPYCEGRGATCATDATCRAFFPGEYRVTAADDADHATSAAPTTVTVIPTNDLTISPTSRAAAYPRLNFNQPLFVAGATGTVTWEAEYIESGAFPGQHLQSPLAAGSATSGYTLTGAGVLNAPGPLVGETVRLNIRAWDAAGDAGSQEFTIVGTAPPACPTLCLYPGPGLLADGGAPPGTSFGLAYNPAYGDGSASPYEFEYRLIINGGVWPDPAQFLPITVTDAAETVPVGPGVDWWVPPLTRIFAPPPVHSGDHLAVRVVETQWNSLGNYLGETTLATSNTVVLE
jgi:hypothetical protein